jgi:hypothetical protein
VLALSKSDRPFSPNMNEAAKRRNGETARKAIRHFRDLEVYQNALAAGLQIYDVRRFADSSSD